MKEIIERLSSYSILNNLIPGVILSFLVTNFCYIDLMQKDIFTGFFVYYFIGLIVSRIGSTVIDPILIKSRLIKFANYKDYVTATKVDEKIDILSESNNFFRTIIAVLLTTGIIWLYVYVESFWPVLKDYSNLVLFISLLILFLLSYRKQTNYIIKRIKSNLP